MKQQTTVVNIYKDRDYDEYIGRAGKGHPGYFGNPYSAGTRDENVKMYKAYFNARIKTDPVFKQRVLSLKGKKLGCFCKPLKCHGDVIADYLNNLK